MKKTILFIPGFVCDTWSTIENYTIELTKALSNDFNIIWLAPSIDNPYNIFKNEKNKTALKEPVYVTKAKENNIQVVTANLSKINLIKNLFVLNKIFKQYKVDATYTEFGFERQIATICSKLLGMKTIFRAHGALGGNYKFLKFIVFNLFMDFFLAVSYYTASFIPKYKKQYVIQNSIDIRNEEKISQDEANAIKKGLGLDKFEIIVTMIAKFDAGKRHNIVAEIIKKIVDKSNKKIGFLFLGSGELSNQFLEQTKQLNINDFVCLPGHVNNIDEYLKISDISILTSLEEGLPCSFLESMNYRLPLVAFNKGWARELITNGINGYLIDIDDNDDFAKALLELINNETKRNEFGQNSYTILKENFSLELWQKKMKNTFKKIMD